MEWWVWFIIGWLSVSLIITSYELMDELVKGRKTRLWRIVAYFLSWIMGVLTPIIKLVSIVIFILKPKRKNYDINEDRRIY